MSRNIALLLAAGSGERMKAVVPKQFLEVEGESILLHTLHAFQRHPLIHEIYVVCQPGWEQQVVDEADEHGISKLSGTIIGGPTNFDSSLSGLTYLHERIDDDAAVVLVHDAVRPLVSQDVISRNIAVCLTHGNAITALQSHEAFMVTNDGHTSRHYIPRDGMLSVQTPLTFNLGTIRSLLRAAEEHGITQSQSLFTLAAELNQQTLHIAQGDVRNIKITESSDLLVYMALKKMEDLS